MQSSTASTPGQKADMIAWPAILKYAGQNELAYIENGAAWYADPHLYQFRYVTEDSLIDAQGRVYALPSSESGEVEPQPTGRRMELQEVVALVGAHAAEAGACCVAKFQAASIREALEAVRTD